MGDEPGAKCGTTFTIATRITHPSIPAVSILRNTAIAYLTPLPVRLTRVVLQAAAESGAR